MPRVVCFRPGVRRQIMTHMKRSIAALLGFGLATLPGSFSAQYELERVWEIPPEAGSFLTPEGHNQRGMAYNPQTGHLLIIDRSQLSFYGALVWIIEAETGQILGELDRSAVTGAGNSSFPMSLIGVAEDGAIYSANLSNSTSAPSCLR